MQPTQIKICGITRAQDARLAAGLGADALGLVFYPQSPRCVTPAAAVEIVNDLAPFISIVGLFVNASAAEVNAVLAKVPLSVLQFHGEEDEAYCRAFARPYIKAARVTPELDLIEYANRFKSARAILLDAHVEGYGGAGQVFDWDRIPEKMPLPVILAGGLSVDNVDAAIDRVRPVAVDVSSGVEASKGVKDAAKLAQFIYKVKHHATRVQDR
jgi:phosphoribosylanthranilate isomerase